MDRREPRFAHGRRSFNAVGKGQCQRQRFSAAAGHDATSMKYMNMSSLMRVKFFTWRMLFFVASIDAYLTGRSACGNHFVWHLDVPCVFRGGFFKFTVSLFGSTVRETLLVT